MLDKKKLVYLVVFNWSTQDDNNIDIHIFDSYEKASDKYDEIIAMETTEEQSWAYDAFNKDGTVNDGYEFYEIKGNKKDKTYRSWNLIHSSDTYDFIELKIMEVQ